MANVPFSQMYDQLLPYLPGAETPLIDVQIRKILRDFMTRTTIQREEFGFTTVAGSQTYKLTPTYGEVCRVIEVWAQGSTTPLPVATENQRGLADAGQPTGWWTMIEYLLSLYPMPDADGYAIKVNAAVRPALDTPDIPEDIYNAHAEVLAAGVLSVMYGMAGKPWTAQQDAIAQGRLYGNAVATIRGTLRDGGKPNQSTVIPARRFGK